MATSRVVLLAVLVVGCRDKAKVTPEKPAAPLHDAEISEKLFDKAKPLVKDALCSSFALKGDAGALTKLAGPSFRATAVPDAAPKTSESGGVRVEEYAAADSRPSLEIGAFREQLEVWRGHFASVSECEPLFNHVSVTKDQSRVEVGGRVVIRGSGRAGGLREDGLEMVAQLDATKEPWSLLEIRIRGRNVVSSPGKIFTEVTREALPALASQDSTPRGARGAADTAPRQKWSGVTLFDFDDDGDVDMLLPGMRPYLLENLGGMAFRDVTQKWLGALHSSFNSFVFADFDNDRDADLLTIDGQCQLFENAGGSFVPRHEALPCHLAENVRFVHASVGDYDGDGHLDIWLLSWGRGVEDGIEFSLQNSYVDATNGGPKMLLKNEGKFRFSDVTERAGVANTRFAYGGIFLDYDEDGDLDFYESNDFGIKNFFRNNGDGTFTDIAAQNGSLDPGSGMGIDWLDIDRDGDWDIYQAQMWSKAGQRVLAQDKELPEELRNRLLKHALGNSLLINDGGNFTERSGEFGGRDGGWAWSPVAMDFNNDGWKDLFVVNGYVAGTTKKDL